MLKSEGPFTAVMMSFAIVGVSFWGWLVNGVSPNTCMNSELLVEPNQAIVDFTLLIISIGNHMLLGGQQAYSLSSKHKLWSFMS